MDLEKVNIDDVFIQNRLRKDIGDIDQLSKSISDNGLIQPIVLTILSTSDEENKTPHEIILVAGERRYHALKKLGITTLERGVHFIWRDDLASDEYRRTAVELEENIRRKAMTWSEEILGKQKLLEVYQRIYGIPAPGQPTRSVQQGLKPAGFGVRKLAELLNENASTTSEDLEMAALITQLPILKNEPSREAAKRKLELAIKIQTGMLGTHVAKPLAYKILIECESEVHQVALLAQFRTAGLKCQAIVA
jgi:ParB-like nuclease family protein